MIGTRKNNKDIKSIIRNVFIVIVICAIGGYAGFQSKKIISGPQITIQSPSTTSANNGTVDVSGIVKNVSVVTLNDRLIPIDETGQFKEKVLLYHGYNVIKLKATDKFGAFVTKELQLVYADDVDGVDGANKTSDVEDNNNITKDTKSAITTATNTATTTVNVIASTTETVDAGSTSSMVSSATSSTANISTNNVGNAKNARSTSSKSKSRN